MISLTKKTKIIQAPVWRATIEAMEINTYFDAPFRHENHLRNIVSILRGSGFQYTVTRIGSGIRVTRIQ